MQLIVSDALPPQAVADSLATGLAAKQPALVERFARSRASLQPWPLQTHGCTPAEGLALVTAGHRAESGEALSAGLGPWRAGVSDASQRVWIADFCSTVITQERAVLIARDHLALTDDEAKALDASVGEIFAAGNAGLRIHPVEPGRWRVEGDLPIPQRVISPLALQGQDVGDWWPMGHAWRDWRRLLNEVQMSWHQSPVNAAREAGGSPPINGVWLYGGARGWQPQPDPTVRWIHDLSIAAASGDWTRWLEIWGQIAPQLVNADLDSELVLTGQDRLVRLTNSSKAWWKSLFAKSNPKTWRDWWANRD